jgi:hypothetical protein
MMYGDKRKALRRAPAQIIRLRLLARRKAADEAAFHIDIAKNAVVQVTQPLTWRNPREGHS